MEPRVAPARADERWRPGSRGRRLSTFMVAVVVVSLVLHAALLATILLGVGAEAAPQQEIPVEVVEEVPPVEAPKPAPQVAPPPAPAPKPLAAKLEAPKPEAPKPELPKPKPPEPVAAKPPAPSAAETQKAELERQLDELKAEQQALKTASADEGPLRDSIRAIALPSVGDGDGEVVGYQSLVFSQLAKAKEGVQGAAKAATVGVRFSVDDNGGLVDVSVAVSSGVAALDAESMAIVRRAAPFPKPPSGAERTFSANFAYAAMDR